MKVALDLFSKIMLIPIPKLANYPYKFSNLFSYVILIFKRRNHLFRSLIYVQVLELSKRI